jgi:hypothetical protein
MHFTFQSEDSADPLFTASFDYNLQIQSIHNNPMILLTHHKTGHFHYDVLKDQE